MKALKARLRSLEQGKDGVVCVPLNEGETLADAAAAYKTRSGSLDRRSVIFLDPLDLAI